MNLSWALNVSILSFVAHCRDLVDHQRQLLLDKGIAVVLQELNHVLPCPCVPEVQAQSCELCLKDVC